MTRRMKTVLIVSMCGSVTGALAAWAPRPQEGERANQQDPAAATCPAFEQLKTLVGEWAMPDSDSDGAPDGQVSYKLISAGSVVMETVFPDQPHEMVTMYHMDGPDLLVTHYCAAGNQPRMKAKRTDDPGKVEFAFKDGTNMDPSKDMYMGALTVTFTDADHFTQEWTSFEDGKPGEPLTFQWTRAKPAAAN